MARFRTLPPMHPGEVLREEFMDPMGLSPYALANRCDIPRTRIERIIKETVGITADTALRLAKFFGTTPEFWLNLQARFEIEKTRREIASALDDIEPQAA